MVREGDRGHLALAVPGRASGEGGCHLLVSRPPFPPVPLASIRGGRRDVGLSKVMLWPPASPPPRFAAESHDQTRGHPEEPRERLFSEVGQWHVGFLPSTFRCFLVFNNYMLSLYKGQKILP